MYGTENPYGNEKGRIAATSYSLSTNYVAGGGFKTLIFFSALMKFGILANVFEKGCLEGCELR